MVTKTNSQHRFAAMLADEQTISNSNFIRQQFPADGTQVSNRTFSVH
jgi:hypothetical protein